MAKPDEPTTRPSGAAVEEFLADVPDEQRRADAKQLNAMFEDVTGEKATMWGPSIVGFGEYHYTYASGREGDATRVGFAPRKQNFALYGLLAEDERRVALLERLGPHSTGKGCLYIKRMSDVDEKVLRELIEEGYRADREGEADQDGA